MLAVLFIATNDALLVVENANIGWSAEHLIERGYRNLHYSADDDTTMGG
jgi:hypothetical protein